MLHDEPGAIDLARRAEDIGDRLGARDVLSDALNTRAVCVAKAGGNWIGLLSRALRIALDNDLPQQAGRAYGNIAGRYNLERQFAAAERYLADGLEYCDERDLADFANFLRGDHANALERTGRWRESAIASTELLDRSVPSPANRICILRRLGVIQARLGGTDVWQYLDEAAAAADASREPRAASRSRSCRCGWPGPRRTGWPAGPPTPPARPSSPTMPARTRTLGSMARWPCG